MAKTKDILTDFAENTGLPGITKIATSKPLWKKLFWIIVLTLTLSLFFWQTCLMVQKYLSYPVNVVIEMGFKELEFPAVSICNLNRFRNSQLSTAGPELERLLSHYNKTLLQQMTGLNDTQLNDVKRELARARRQNMDYTTGSTPKYFSRYTTPYWLNDDRYTLGVDSTEQPLHAANTVLSPDNSFGSTWNLPKVDLEKSPWYKNQTSASVKLEKDMTLLLSSISTPERAKMGHQVTDFIQELRWAGINQSPDSFKAFSSSEFGNCYTFNSADDRFEILKGRRSGPLFGLSMTLLIEQDEYVGPLAQAAGARVVIHDPDEQPFPEEEGFEVLPGVKTSVSLKMKRIIRQSKPYGNCTHGEDTELYYSKRYSVEACMRTCLQRITIKRCSCAEPSIPVPKTGSHVPCFTHEELDCVDRIKESYVRGEKGTECKCPAACEEVRYSTTLSHSSWPSDHYTESLKEQLILRGGKLKELLSVPDDEVQEVIKKNFIKLNIYFGDLNFEVYRQVPAYEISNLLGDIGGQMGMWVGLSVVALMEVVELFGVIFFHLVNRGEKASLLDGQDR